MNQFYENAIAAEEFAIMMERRIKDAMDHTSKNVDIEKLQMICWKWVDYLHTYVSYVHNLQGSVLC